MRTNKSETNPETRIVVYIAPQLFETELSEELLSLGIVVTEQRNRLFLCEKNDSAPNPVWAQNTWFDPTFIPVPSINQAAKSLKQIQRNWACHPTAHFRRATLIQEKLPKVSAKPLEFSKLPPNAPLGSWTLWEENLLLLSPSCTSPFVDGELHFQENKTDPPGRAYLKLWETLTLIGKFPTNTDVCLDLGSSPGGWTWVMASLNSKVISIDKAPLAANVAALPNVEYIKGSAFSLNPIDFSHINWLCSDVICYPERLYNLVSLWLDKGYTGNIICTLKFQGPTDFKTIDLFRSIPGGKLIHLFHNKHELTWIRLNT